ncbi:MAG TPA: 4Fe-4S ferredoxin, partial [Firmicutes bacterium]|nr:4Fe-4S ferredoxin [Bacillota bacterium]
TQDDLDRGKANLTCTKCAKCISACPRKAISLEVKGTEALSHHGGRVRLYFLYPAFILLLTMGSGMMENAIYRILLLLTTGKMIH